MTNKIYETLPFFESKELAEELFPIGSTIIVHTNEKTPKGSPGIILGHLLSRKDIEKSIRLLNKVEISFSSICRVVVLLRKNKHVCYFDSNSGQINLFTSKLDVFNESLYKRMYEDWVRIGEHIN